MRSHFHVTSVTPAKERKSCRHLLIVFFQQEICWLVSCVLYLPNSLYVINLLFCPSVDKLPSSDVWSFLNCQPCTQTQQLQDEACSSITAPIFILFSSFTVLSCYLFPIRSAVLPQDSGFKILFFVFMLQLTTAQGFFSAAQKILPKIKNFFLPSKCSEISPPVEAPTVETLCTAPKK